jgi:hypothetical protein
LTADRRAIGPLAATVVLLLIVAVSAVVIAFFVSGLYVQSSPSSTTSVSTCSSSTTTQDVIDKSDGAGHRQLQPTHGRDHLEQPHFHAGHLQRGFTMKYWQLQKRTYPSTDWKDCGTDELETDGSSIGRNIDDFNVDYRMKRKTWREST